MKKFYYVHDYTNTHSMAISQELANRIINNSDWFVNQCGRDYDAESPTGKLFCIMVREQAVDFGVNSFDWTEHPVWM